MKKRTALFCSCCILLACVACGGPSALSGVSSGESALQAQEQDIPRALSNEPATQLYFTQSTYVGAGNENGYYILLEQIADIPYQSITYVDYATGNWIYLCNQPGCQHNSEACTSYIAMYGSTVSAIPLPACLLLFYGGNGYMREEYGAYALPHIANMGLNGSDGKTLYSFEPNTRMREDGFAYDENFIYLLTADIEEHQEEDPNKSVLQREQERKDSLEMRTTTRLLRINTSTGEQQEICRRKFSENMLGVYQDKVLLSRMRPPETWSGSQREKELEALIFSDKVRSEAEQQALDEEWYALLEQKWNECMFELVAVSVTDGAETLLLSLQGIPDDSTVLQQEHMLYMIDQANEMLVLNLETGEQTTQTLYAPQGAQSLLGFVGVFDKQVLVEGLFFSETLNFDVAKRFKFDLSTGKTTGEITLMQDDPQAVLLSSQTDFQNYAVAQTLAGSYQEGGLQFLSGGHEYSPIDILAETPDSFLVIRGEEYVKELMPGMEGEYYEVDRGHKIYSLIKKSDYWANTNIYQDLTLMN